MSSFGIAFRRSFCRNMNLFVAPAVKRDCHLDHLSVTEVMDRLGHFNEAGFINFPGMYFKKLFSVWGAFIKYRFTKNEADLERALDLAHGYNVGMKMALKGYSADRVHYAIFGENY